MGAHASIDPDEIKHFSKDADKWWDETGPFRPLHKLTPVRMRYIGDRLREHYNLSDEGLKPLTGLTILDVGCGGGLVCEPLARLGATVTGLDADPVAIKAARSHAEEAELNNITYLNEAAEDHLEAAETRYDAVLALEIIEHVADYPAFIKTSASLCKPGGLMIFSTLNRTAKSAALGIIAAEYLLGWVPRGTHQWSKFIKPGELAAALRQAGTLPKNEKGLIFNPLKNDFQITNKDLKVNYFMTAEKL